MYLFLWKCETKWREKVKLEEFFFESKQKKKKSTRQSMLFAPFDTIFISSEKKS